MSNKWSKGYFADLAERVGSVLVYSLITYLTLDNVLENVDFKRLWLVIVLPTVLSFLKGLAANLKDSESGASLLNPPPGPVITEEPAVPGEFADDPYNPERGESVIGLAIAAVVLVILVLLVLRIA